jgi:hypothetical protein
MVEREKLLMASIWGPAGMTKEEELFNQQVQAPKGAPLANGFWETITPQILGAVANAFIPGSKEAVATATNELQGGDPVQTQTPEFNGQGLDSSVQLASADGKYWENQYNNVNPLWMDPTRARQPGESMIKDGIWHGPGGVNYQYGSNPLKQYGPMSLGDIYG